MNLADEIERLSEQRNRGVLSEDEFQLAKARLLGCGTSLGAGSDAAPAAAAINGLRRSRSDRWIAGVCGWRFAPALGGDGDRQGSGGFGGVRGLRGQPADESSR